MSTKLRILFFLCGIISSNLFSQAGTSCATAIPIPNPPGNLPTQVQVNNEQWFVFHDTISGSGDVTIANSGDTTNYINHVNVYKGSCSNLQLLTSATITSYSSDLSMDIAVNSDPTDLYIQTFRTPPVNNSLVKLGIYVDVQFQNNPFMASVCSNGKVQAWGDNSMGQLGRNTGFSTFSATPTNILPFGNDLSPAVAVSMGGNHAVAMLSDGTVWTWGDDQYGQLGVDPVVIQNTNGLTYTFIPQQVPLPNGSKAIAVAAAGDFSLVLLNNNTVYVWGRSNFCVPYSYISTDYILRPLLNVNTGLPYSGVIQIAACTGAAAVLLNNLTVDIVGTLHCPSCSGCMDGYPGSLGVISNAIAITAGHDHVLAVLSDGSIRTTGPNNDYELGTGVQGQCAVGISQTPVGLGSCTGILDIAGGFQTSYALLNNGKMMFWGTSNAGENGDCTQYPAPNSTISQFPSPTIQNVAGVRDITTGADLSSTIFTKTNGANVTAGYDANVGALGTGTVIAAQTSCSPLNTTICTKPDPTIAIFSSPSQYCTSQTITLTAILQSGQIYGATPTYIWTDQNCNVIASGLNMNSITIPVSSTNGNTYTCNYYFNNDGYIRGAMAKYIVNGSPCLCFTPTYTISSNNSSSVVFASTGGSPPSGSSILVNAGVTLSINANCVLDNCKVQLDANADIVVLGGRALTITNESHLFSCAAMWKGIALKPNSTLNVNGDSWIEDAITAVDVIAANLPGIYNINTAIFNKNKTNILIEPNPVNVYSGMVQNSIFTCRILPASPTVLSLKLNLSSYQATLLLAPNGNQRTNIGVDVNNNRQVNVGVPALDNENIFDNMNYGVWSKNSGTVVRCNIFQYMAGKTILSNNSMSSTTTGIAVWGQSPVTTSSLLFQVGGPSRTEANYFTDCNSCVSIDGGYTTILVQLNSLFASSTPSPLIANQTHIGESGIYINAEQPPTINNVQQLQSISVLDNGIINYVTGIHQTRAGLAHNLSISYDRNNISASVNGYCSNGIYLSDPFNYSPNIASTFEVKDNYIQECYTCIRLLNIKKSIDVETNYCGIRYGATGLRLGIAAYGCIGNAIKSNHVIGDNHAAAVAGGNINVSGIYLQKSTSMLVQCNLIEETGRSMVFDGNCISSTNYILGIYYAGIVQNTMRNAQQGFVMKNSMAIIGQQGNPYASQNIWDLQNGSFSPYETYNNGANLASSELYVRNITAGLVEYPLLNGGGTPYSLVNGINNSIGLTTSACNPLPPPANNGGFSSQLERIATDTTVFPTYNIETHWQEQKFVFDMLNADSSLHTPTLHSFMQQQQGGNMDKLLQVDKLIAIGNYQQAHQINQTVNPQTLPEQNQKDFNFYFIQRLNNPNHPYTPTEQNALYGIANQCPLEGGNAVYQARAWIMAIENHVVDFVDPCVDSSSTVRLAAPPQNQTTVSQDLNFRIYPNPNNGAAHVEYMLPENSTGVLDVYSSTGMLMESLALPANSSKVDIDGSTWENGIYFYRISAQGKTLFIGRSVILR